jgi:uncharacterized protein YrrD
VSESTTQWEVLSDEVFDHSGNCLGSIQLEGREQFEKRIQCFLMLKEDRE